MTISPLAKKLAVAFLSVSALGYGGHKLISSITESTPPPQVAITNASGETNTVTKQTTASLREARYGRQYYIWNGLIAEEFINSDEHNFRTDFDHNIYDFDTGIIYHTTNDENSEGGGIATTYFNDIAIDSVLPQHIENVRQVGCELAENYMERARSGEHGPPPDDVTYFYRNHCL